MTVSEQIRHHCKKPLLEIFKIPILMEHGPVFIGGLDRCGKTTMRAFLASHPRIAIPAVGSNMRTYFYGQYGDLARDSNLERCLEDLMNYKHVAFLKPDPERIRREFRQGSPTYARLFELFLIHFAESENKPRWGVQTGLIERYADHIFAAYPGARMIHLVRDPRDRYEASLALWPNGKLRAGGAAARWLYSMKLARRNLNRHAGCYLTVRYETMVSKPEETLREICQLLDEQYFPAMLAMEGAPSFRRKITNGSNLKDGQIPVTTEYIGRYCQGVPKEEIAFIQSRVGREMLAYEYVPDTIHFSPGERLHYALNDRPVNLMKMLVWCTVEAVQHRLPGLAGRTPSAKMILNRKRGRIGQAATH